MDDETKAALAKAIEVFLPAPDVGRTWSGREALFASLRGFERPFVELVAARTDAFLLGVVSGCRSDRTVSVDGVTVDVVVPKQEPNASPSATVRGRDGRGWRVTWEGTPPVTFCSLHSLDGAGGAKLVMRTRIAGARPGGFLDPMWNTREFREVVRFAEAMEHDGDSRWKAKRALSHYPDRNGPLEALLALDGVMPGRNVRLAHRALYDAVAARVASWAAPLLKANIAELAAAGRFWEESHLAFSRMSDGIVRHETVTDRVCVVRRADGGPDALLHVDTQQYLRKTPYLAWVDGNILCLALLRADDVAFGVEAFVLGGAPAAMTCDLSSGETTISERFVQADVLPDFADHCGEVRALLATVCLYREPGDDRLYSSDFTKFTGAAPAEDREPGGSRLEASEASP